MTRINKQKKKAKKNVGQVSIEPGQRRALKYCLAATVVFSVLPGFIETEEALHRAMMLFLPLAAAGLLRSDYGKPFLLTERWATVLLVVYVVIFSLVVALFVGNLTLPVFLAYFSFGTMIARIMGRLTDRYIYQLLFLSIGLTLINCILTNHILFALILPLYVFSLMGSLLGLHRARHDTRLDHETKALSQAEPEMVRSRKYFKYAALMLGGAALVFLILPRPFTVFPGLSAAVASRNRLQATAKSISYKDMVGMSGRNRIAFTARFDLGPIPDDPYWRGRVLAKADDQGWRPGPRGHGLPARVRLRGVKPMYYTVSLHRLSSDTVYVHGLPIWALGFRNAELMINSLAEVSVDTPFSAAKSYRIKAVDVPIPVKYSNRIYLDRGGLTPKIEALAMEWTKNASTPKAKAEAIMSKLLGDYKYSLEVPPPPEGTNAIEYFLFQSRKGHCEYFAGAMALMLRAVDVPSRVVEGFMGMEKTSDPKEFIIRFERAHAWVEAILGETYWTRLDPTPASAFRHPRLAWLINSITDAIDRIDYWWDETVVHFDKSDQMGMLVFLTNFLTGRMYLSLGPFSGPAAYLLLFLVLAEVGLVAFLWTLRKRKVDSAGIYFRTMKRLVSKGLLPKVDMWHERNTAEIRARAPELGPDVEAFTKLYLERRFGKNGREAATDLSAASRELLRKAG